MKIYKQRLISHQNQISELRADVRVSDSNYRVLEARFATHESETKHILTQYKNWILSGSGGVLLVIHHYRHLQIFRIILTHYIFERFYMVSRIISYLLTFGMLSGLCIAFIGAVYIRSLLADLPDYEVLSRYEPPVTTRFHASDGSLMAEYAHERRLYTPIEEIPQLLREAFLSAEDKGFYEHSGMNYFSMAKAAFDAVYNKALNRRVRLRGASTITQQVAKNFLLTSDRTIDRKIKEAILAQRIEQAYTKDEIFELYLNEIFFGLGSYGIAGAALVYFDKAVEDLELHEMAYLAALPKGPNNYHPQRNRKAAIARRNWVLDRMTANGYIDSLSALEAKSEELSITTRKPENYVAASQYFVEEVRRHILEDHGEDTLYKGGLSVRTTLTPYMQAAGRSALLRGLIKFDREQGYRATDRKIDLSKDWGIELSRFTSDF